MFILRIQRLRELSKDGSLEANIKWTIILLQLQIHLLSGGNSLSVRMLSLYLISLRLSHFKGFSMDKSELCSGKGQMSEH